MGSKSSKQEKKQESGAQGAQQNAQANTTLPIESVNDRQTKEAQKRQKAIDSLKTIYVDVPQDGKKHEIQVPPEGAKVVVRGAQGEKVKLTPQQPAPKNNNTVKVIRTYPAGRGGVVYATQPQVQIIKTDGSATTDNIVVVRQTPQVMYCDPYPYYYGYRYPYRYGYPYGYCYW